MKLDIPNHLSLITLEQYVNYMSAVDDIEKVIIICGVSRNKVLGLTPATVSKVIEMFNAVLESNPGEVQYQFKVWDRYRFKRLGMIPDFTAMKLGEYVDLDESSKLLWAEKNPDYSQLYSVMAILFRPIVNRWGSALYSIKPYDSDEVRLYLPFIKRMTMDQVFAAILFFCSLDKKLQTDSRDYLAAEAMRQMRAA